MFITWNLFLRQLFGFFSHHQTFRLRCRRNNRNRLNKKIWNYKLTIYKSVICKCKAIEIITWVQRFCKFTNGSLNIHTKSLRLKASYIKHRNLKLKGTENQFGKLWKVMRSHEKIATCKKRKNSIYWIKRK